MDNLKGESIDWALTHILRFGDTDLFPVPFEYGAIRHSWKNLRDDIAKINLESYEGRPFRRFLVPKQFGGYRVAIQLDPIDTIVYTALAYEAAELVERFRIPLERKIACSYRVEIGSKGELFRSNNGWDDFHKKSQELTLLGTYRKVVTADIADYYNQIGHHRIRNALEAAGVDKARAKNIENLLMNFTRGQSRGIPIGPAASVVFSEACLSDVDNFLLRKGYVHTRYVDDFRIFCENNEEANRALHDLTEYLYTSHRLTLQAHKTQIHDVDSFVVEELIDPEELENKTTAEKLDALSGFFTGYSTYKEDEEPDVDKIVRDNLVELFSNCLTHRPLHLGLAKYLLRRASTLRTGVLREVVLDNIDKLAPVMRETALYVIATTKEAFAETIATRFIKGCRSSDFSFTAYIQYWLTEVLLSVNSDKMEQEVRDLCEEFKENLGSRPFALFAKNKRYIDWVREQKETWQNNKPWDKRAVIWASQALSHDEMNYWIQRVQNAGDILDKAIAEAVLHIKNR